MKGDFKNEDMVSESSQNSNFTQNLKLKWERDQDTESVFTGGES